MKNQKTETLVIRHPSRNILQACHLAKNLYNASLHDVRQHFFNTGEYLTWQSQRVKFVSQNQPDYRALPAKISGEVLRLVGSNFNSFFGLLKAKQNGAYNKQVRIPKYLPKNGLTTLRVPKDAISIDRDPVENRHGEMIYTHRISPKHLNIEIRTRVANPQFITLTPKHGRVHVSVVYNDGAKPIQLSDNGRYAAIDLGVNNLAAMIDSDGTAKVYNGKPVKSINQFFNKTKAKLTSQLDIRGEVKISKRLQRMSAKREGRINWYFHQVSSDIVNHAVSNDINTVIIGHNPEWKQDINIGRRNNQTFVSIPFAKLIHQIEDKASRHGIRVILTEESYTSKCSFLDWEEVKKHESYLGKRTRRGLFKASDGRIINADINGAGNILRKVVPVEQLNAQGIEDGAVHPALITFSGPCKTQSVIV